MGHCKKCSKKKCGGSCRTLCNPCGPCVLNPCAAPAGPFCCTGPSGARGATGLTGPTGLTGGSVLFTASVGTGPDPSTQTSYGPFDVTVGSTYYLYSTSANLVSVTGSVLTNVAPINQYAYAYGFTGPTGLSSVYYMNQTDFSTTGATGIAVASNYLFTAGKTGIYLVSASVQVTGGTGGSSTGTNTIDLTVEGSAFYLLLDSATKITTSVDPYINTVLEGKAVVELNPSQQIHFVLTPTATTTALSFYNANYAIKYVSLN